MPGFTRVALLVALLAVCCSPAPALAGQYVVGVEARDCYPHYNGQGGEFQDSFAKALLDAFAADQGHQLTYRPLALADLGKELAAGSVDLRYPDDLIWEHEAKKGQGVIYSAPVVPYLEEVMVTKRRLGKSLYNLHHLGTEPGVVPLAFHAVLENKMVSLSPGQDCATLLRQAVNGEVGGAYVNVVSANWHLEHTLKQPDALWCDPDLPLTASNFHLSTIQHAGLIQEFNQWLQDHAQRVRELEERYQVLKGAL